MELTPQQLKTNYDTIIAIIEENISSPRKEKLIKFYDELSEHMMLAPASSLEHFHLAFTGGYCMHIKNVVDASLLVAKAFKHMGGTINFTKEELVFTALNHDLGKVGDGKVPYYIPCQSDWHRKNQGKMFDVNPEITNMSVTDRSLYLLQKGGIDVSENEWIGIKCSDGMYDSSNEYYLRQFSKEKQQKNNLVNIIHWADHMASRVEWDMGINDKLSGMFKS
jgi:hypothetical protein